MTFTAIHLLHAALIGANLLILAELGSSAHRNRLAWVPILYFAALSLASVAAFFDPGQYGPRMLMRYTAEAILPALSFLLMLQFLWQRVPPWPYWLILALPLVGGGGTLYLAAFYEDVCFEDTCWPSRYAFYFYHIFSGSLVLLLFVAILGQKRREAKPAEQYWLLIALVMTHVIQLIARLAVVDGILVPEKEAFIRVMLRVTFVYLVATSVFRVFHKDTLPLHLLYHPAPPKPSPEVLEAEAALAARFTALMEQEKKYRTHSFSRAACAGVLGVKEYVLSRAINARLGTGFHEHLNRYRVEEAKQRLLAEPETPITVIAFEVGFASIPSFNRVFREFCGCSPTQYRSNALAQGSGGSALPSHTPPQPAK
ncbi:MAG: AraC family transcriptional regulator [Alphaproteobacteria bacterium]|nr:AraC family transcriptional regulator [Alphaproteobacteria bacterium]